jgi:hypothetical protein
VAAIPHPAHIIRRLGVTEPPAAVAVSLIAVLQYVFLLKLWLGYPVRGSGNVIHPHVVITALLLSLAGAVAILLFLIRYWAQGAASARRLERPATHSSFDAIRTRLAALARHSTLRQAPDLLYTPKNKLALETRPEASGAAAVVIGLGQRERDRLDPEVMAAKLGHELSHIELGGTRTEILIRRVVMLHFAVLAWLVFLFAVVIGFIDLRGIGSRPAYGGFEPVFATEIYKDLAEQFAVLLFASAIIFIYSYFFVVRREHIHDVRGSQLAGNSALAARVFEPEARKEGLLRKLKDFLELHPTASARAGVIRQRDIILLSAILYPIIVSGIPGPLLQLLTAGWREVFAVRMEWWNLALTVTGGLLMYLILSADLFRLGLSATLRRRTSLRIPLYAVCAALATQLPRVVLELIYGWRRDFPMSLVVERILNGLAFGGARLISMVALVLLGLGYLSAVRIAALGEDRAAGAVWLDRVWGAFILVGAFAIISLTSLGFIFHTAGVIMVLVILRLLLLFTFPHCTQCERRPWEALRLLTRCACGRERLGELRSLVDGHREEAPPTPASVLP